MTQTPEPQQFGPNAGEPGTDQRLRWDQLYRAMTELQQKNAARMQGFAAQGIAGTDLIGQMTRLTCLVDTLFGTPDGHDGIVEMNNPHFRIELELQMQSQIAQALDGVAKMVDQAREAAGQPHRRESGIIVAGRNGKVN